MQLDRPAGRTASGDAAEVRALIDAHAAAMFRVALRLTKDHHAAEDVTQEAFVRLMARDTPLPTTDATRRWLLRVTRNLAISHLRHTTAGRRAVEHRSQIIDLTTASPAHRVEHAALAAVLLEDLSDGERELLIRHHVHGEALAVLAKERQTSTGVVKVQLSRARAKARATGRRRDIDGIPWWIPAPLLRFGTTTKAFFGGAAPKVAAGLLVPAMILGGVLTLPHFVPPNADGVEDPERALLAGTADGVGSGEGPRFPAELDERDSDASQGPSGRSGSLGSTGDTTGPEDPEHFHLDDPIPPHDIRVSDDTPGLRGYEGTHRPHGTQYIIIGSGAEPILGYGVIEADNRGEDDGGPTSMSGICDVVAAVPDAVAECRVEGEDD